jgi:hypothetical protein
MRSPAYEVDLSDDGHGNAGNLLGELVLNLGGLQLGRNLRVVLLHAELSVFTGYVWFLSLVPDDFTYAT